MESKKYRVVLTVDAEGDMDAFLRYIVHKLKNLEAAVSLLDDFERALSDLERSAGSLKLDGDPKLARLGYRRAHMKRHSYFMLYRIDGDIAVVDRIFHDRQDYRNRIE